MSNFKSPAFQICHFHSMRAGYLLTQKGPMDVRDDRLVTSSNLQYDLSDVIVGKSRVMLGVRAYEARWPSVYATRQVRSFERGLLEVRGGDWVVASMGGESFVGRVGEMVEFAASGGSFVRLLLAEMRPISSFDELRGQCIVVSCDVPSIERIVSVESTSFHELLCNDEHARELKFTYVY